jgi:hypothetical protein
MQFRAAGVLPLDQDATRRRWINVVQKRADLQMTTQRPVPAAAVEAGLFGHHRFGFVVEFPIVQTAL